MPDVKKYTEKTEVETETKHDSDESGNSEHKKTTTVKTERTVEKDRDPVIIVEEE